VAAKFLPAMAQRLLAAGVQLKGCPRTRAVVVAVVVVVPML
jgi:hypothetical protein